MSEPVSVRAAVEIAVPHLARRPLLIASDFDGTLSNIVNDPWAARILPLGRRALRALAALPDVHVAVLSGRTAPDVAARVRVGRVAYLGNHGMERGDLGFRHRPENMATTVDGASDVAGAMAERLAVELPRAVPDEWLVVERKPPAVAFHFRTAPDVAAAGQAVRAAVDAIDTDGVLERFPGRRVLELRPPGAVAKGEALAGLVSEIRPRAAVVLGDDVSDALAFEALRDLRARGATDGLAVAVRARGEVPARVSEAADLILESPTAATRFLASLARHLAGA